MEVDILYVCNRIDIITCIMGVIVLNEIGMKFFEKSVILYILCVFISRHAWLSTSYGC